MLRGKAPLPTFWLSRSWLPSNPLLALVRSKLSSRLPQIKNDAGGQPERFQDLLPYPCGSLDFSAGLLW